MEGQREKRQERREERLLALPRIPAISLSLSMRAFSALSLSLHNHVIAYVIPCQRRGIFAFHVFSRGH